MTPRYPCGMTKKRLLLSAAIALPFFAQPAFASGDYGCTTSWQLEQSDYSRCDNVAFLNPGNDTIINMQLLVIDSNKAEFFDYPNATPAEENTPPEIPYPNMPFFEVREFTARYKADAPGPDKAEYDERLAYGEGSRFVSAQSGASDFTEALGKSSGITSSERDLLTKARAALNGENGVASYTPVIGLKSKTATEFASYLSAAQAFYNGSFVEAQNTFAALTKSNQPWIKEASHYMLGRVALNVAQVNGFGEYGDLQRDKLDKDALVKADNDFKVYLGTYKNGRYAASARGLLRRVYWLQGREDKLASEMAYQFASADPKARSNTLIALAYEADQKLLPELDRDKVRDPLLLATLDLQAMRSVDLPEDPEARAAKQATLLTFTKLQAQKDIFKGQNDLFEYLLATHLYHVGKDPKAALGHLPNTIPANQTGTLEFSRQVLRGMALEATGGTSQARILWKQLIPWTKQPLQSSAAQLGLAMNYEKAKQLSGIFEAGSPITNSSIRQIILRNVASPALLAAQAKAKNASEEERREAQYTLLYKDLIYGRYGAFAGDMASVGKLPPAEPNNYLRDFGIFTWGGNTEKSSYPCPGIRDIAKTLAVAPSQANALLCMGEFTRTQGLDYHDLNGQPGPSELGGGPSEFAGQVFSRGEAYKRVIANPKASRSEVAYALYRAVNCYAPSASNSCGGKDVPVSQRKKWFQTLKGQYKDSEWASRLNYYW
jgi:hypothetical protein